MFVYVVQDFVKPELLQSDFAISDTGTYRTLVASEEEVESAGGPLACYTRHIDGLPLDTEPELFGLSNNANIACDIAEGEALFGSLLAIQVR